MELTTDLHGDNTMAITFLKRGTVTVSFTPEELSQLNEMTDDDRRLYLTRFLRSCTDDVLINATHDLKTKPHYEKDEIAVFCATPETVLPVNTVNDLGDLYCSPLYSDWWADNARINKLISEKDC